MNIWILSANPRLYDHEKAFHDQGYVIWKQTRKFETGDIVYVYCTKPMAKVRYKTVVKEINLKPCLDKYWLVDIDDARLGNRAMKLSLISSCDDNGLIYEKLKNHGMQYPPQSPCKINDELRIYLESFFEERLK